LGLHRIGIGGISGVRGFNGGGNKSVKEIIVVLGRGMLVLH
jgi:hypothetical protein